MKISIIVPVYNVEEYIEDCLRSITAQTYKGEVECIIVDDCTPDSSCTIIEKFISKYAGNIQFKLLHHEKNRGLSAARNTGIDATTGEYIYFLDSDDEITPNCIELLAEPLKKEKYDFVIGDYKTVGSETKFPPLLLKEGEITRALTLIANIIAYILVSISAFYYAKSKRNMWFLIVWIVAVILIVVFYIVKGF